MTLLAALGSVLLVAQSPVAADFAEARRVAAALPQLYSLMVSHRGEVVLEHHARGYSTARHVNVKSASKSIISTLVGIAIAAEADPRVSIQPSFSGFPSFGTRPIRANRPSRSRIC